MALNFKSLITRTTTASLFVAILLFCINYNFLSFAGLFLVISIWALYEFYQLSEKLGAKPYKPIGYLTGGCIFCFSVISNSNMTGFFPKEIIFVYILLFAYIVFIIALFDDNKKIIQNMAYTFLGLIYAVLPFAVLLNIACIDKNYTLNHQTGNWIENFAPYNPHYVLGIILLIWASDAGAYLVGSLIGKHKLYERISPGKTWEGSIGSAILTIGCSFIIAYWYPELTLKYWIIITLIICVFGTLGDLVESMLKRQAGVKDSGSIMPGHGGILDRFDSLLFVTPFIYAFLILVR